MVFWAAVLALVNIGCEFSIDWEVLEQTRNCYELKSITREQDVNVWLETSDIKDGNFDGLRSTSREQNGCKAEICKGDDDCGETECKDEVEGEMKGITNKG